MKIEIVKIIEGIEFGSFGQISETHAYLNKETGEKHYYSEYLDNEEELPEDIDIDVDILLEGDDRVAWQRTLRATHEGTFKGFPATGLQIVWRDMITSQFLDGLISEEWVVTDLAEQLLLSRKRKS